MKPQVRKQAWIPTRELLPLILGKDLGEDLDEKEVAKLELFEKGLSNELNKEDSIEQAITKIVKIALTAEFGPSLVAAKGAKPMIETIKRGIIQDPELRKQALLIIDRLANA